MFPLRQFLFQKNSRDILLFEKKKRDREEYRNEAEIAEIRELIRIENSSHPILFQSA